MDTSPKEVLVRVYELTYLIPGGMSDQDVEKVRATVEAILKKAKAEIVAVEDWGKKPLAYVITHEGKKQSDATYTHVISKLETLKAPAVEREVALQPQVMRHLMLAVDEKEQAKTATAAKAE